MRQMSVYIYQTYRTCLLQYVNMSKLFVTFLDIVVNIIHIYSKFATFIYNKSKQYTMYIIFNNDDN